MSAKENLGFHAFTLRYNGRSNRITTNVSISMAFNPENPPESSYPEVQVIALWDTGATQSVVTAKTASELGLIPVGQAQVNHAGGSSVSHTYLVNFVLPNKVGVAGVLVSECPDIVGDFGAIIGMDIIGQGDLALSCVDNQTTMSFRIPSLGSIDYVVEANRIKYAGVNRNAPCPCGKSDSQGKPVKFKYCHGKTG